MKITNEVRFTYIIVSERWLITNETNDINIETRNASLLHQYVICEYILLLCQHYLKKKMDVYNIPVRVMMNMDIYIYDKYLLWTKTIGHFSSLLEWDDRDRKRYDLVRNEVQFEYEHFQMSEIKVKGTQSTITNYKHSVTR